MNKTFQKVTFYAEGHTKSDSRVVAEIKRGEIAAGEDDIWSGVEMLVPALPPSNLEFCRIIDIDYTLEVTLANFISTLPFSQIPTLTLFALVHLNKLFFVCYL